jgi:1-acyl-sn-glycerol-3-phosphate acyltransferase
VKSFERPDLAALGEGQLTRIESLNLKAIARTFDPGAIDSAVRFLQRTVGAGWINFFTRNLRNVYGLERLPAFDGGKSYLCVANHRSFFDLYVVTASLVARGMPHRIVFPVRSNFFYDHPLGIFVNGAMSFLAMYPPLFRDKERAALNLASLDELVWLLRRGGTFCGVHPEGTRNKSDDPYSFLPAQGGIGRVIHRARVTVLPVFINGLGNDIVRQIGSDILKSGEPIVAVFGEPVDFGDMLDKNASPRLFRQISQHALDAVAKLGDEERAIRATF